MERRSTEAQFDKSVPNKVSGYAIRFNEPTQITDFVQGRLKKFTEVVRSGSVNLDSDTKVLWSHDDRNVLGSTAAGTAKLSTDERGVLVEVALPESAVREREALARGDVNGLSFRFSVQEEKWEGNTRNLLKITVPEVSFVAFNAYENSKVTGMRSRNLMLLEIAEKSLR